MENKKVYVVGFKALEYKGLVEGENIFRLVHSMFIDSGENLSDDDSEPMEFESQEEATRLAIFHADSFKSQFIKHPSFNTLSFTASISSEESIFDSDGDLIDVENLILPEIDLCLK
tara:strand:+ start:2493 stop:2840 length:348 start_codon:yes stop_codon:yes gene_type:complete